MNRKRVLIADSALLGITFVWGTTFIVVQNILDKLTPLTFNAWRFLIAALFLLLWQYVRRKKSAHTLKNINWPLIGSGTLLGGLLFAGYVCQTIALLYTSASNAAFITGLSVVLVPIFSAFLLHQTPRRTALLSVPLAAVGLFFLTTHGSFVLNKGDLIVLVSSVTFALHIVFTAKVTERYDSYALTIVQLFTVSCLAFAFSLFLEGGNAFAIQQIVQLDVLVIILFMALFATALAFLLQTALQKDTPATHVGIIYIMEPVFAAWTSILFQNAQFGTHEIAGSLLILVGMLLAEWPENLRKPKQSQEYRT
ncbi:DMT family transporter [Sporolactobacillus terrae]|uniref:DMT family transporter n=1 Tax=Sporolactobacillus terrae TaxID=269673 RepID=UPI00048AFA7A|nr:DMT family transporter [Sporolactobacillus terrae]